MSGMEEDFSFFCHQASLTFVRSVWRIGYFPVIVVTCIICIWDVVLVLCLPMLSLTVVLRVLGKVFSV